MTTPRPRFSERMGLVTPIVQTDGMNDALRYSIWNIARRLLPVAGSEDEWFVVQAVTENVLRLPIEWINKHDPTTWLFEQVRGVAWPVVYDVLDYLVDIVEDHTAGHISRAEAEEAANHVLAREHSGFRFIGRCLTRGIDPTEAAEVERALATARRAGLDGVHEHITRALALFGKRPDPDNHNAIKEAVSAVEGTVKLITGVRDGGLDKALEVLSSRIEIHPALKAALKNLYGYASDEGGVRHAQLDASSNVGEEDARFMIATCSAAVNWVIAKADKAGVLKKGSA